MHKMKPSHLSHQAHTFIRAVPGAEEKGMEYELCQQTAKLQKNC